MLEAAATASGLMTNSSSAFCTSAILEIFAQSVGLVAGELRVLRCTGNFLEVEEGIRRPRSELLRADPSRRQNSPREVAGSLASMEQGQGSLMNLWHGLLLGPRKHNDRSISNSKGSHKIYTLLFAAWGPQWRLYAHCRDELYTEDGASDL